MSELGRFQDAFAAALSGDEAGLGDWLEPDHGRGLAVYRNTVAKGCADALAAQHPSVVRVVGEAWMRAAAVRFAAAHPPTAPSLASYGGGFADWLATFEPAADMPWLADLARIDWAHGEALAARDLAPMAANALAGLAPADYGGIRLPLHPAARILWFETGAADLWIALQAQTAPQTVELTPQPQGLLLVRPHLEVTPEVLGPGGYALLQACRGGETLAGAGAAALEAEPDLALAATFAHLIGIGAFAAEHP